MSAQVIDLHLWKIRAALRELEEGRARAEAAQAILDQADAEVVAEIRPPPVFGACVCAFCMRFAADLPCGNYPACSCCGKPVRPKRRKTQRRRRARKTSR